jgi:hypothetical protein
MASSRSADWLTFAQVEFTAHFRIAHLQLQPSDDDGEWSELRTLLAHPHTRRHLNGVTLFICNDSRAVVDLVSLACSAHIEELYIDIATTEMIAHISRSSLHRLEIKCATRECDLSPLFDSASLAESLLSLKLDGRHLFQPRTQSLRNLHALTTLELWMLSADEYAAVFGALLTEAPLMPALVSIDLHVDGRESTAPLFLEPASALAKHCPPLRHLRLTFLGPKPPVAEDAALRVRDAAATADRPNFELLINA